MTQATAVLYYEAHPTQKGEFHIALIFPDLKQAGFTACHTVGSSREDVLEAGRDILELAFEESTERGLTFPDATPLLKVKVDHGHDYQPFRIVVENISI